MIYIVKSKDETRALAKSFATKLKKGDIVCLNGDLGAGKTTFTQFVFSALGVKSPVSSPTFSILKIYQGDKFRLNHFDTYRITDMEAIEAGFDEILEDKDSVSFIEWSENISSLIPSKHIDVNIKILDENSREFEIKYE